MHVAVVTGPARWIDLAQAKTMLGVEHSEQDAFIDTCTMAAMQYLDGPSGYLRRSIGEQELAATVYRFPIGRGPADGLALPYGPVMLITSIKHIDPSGEAVNVDPAVYELTPDGRVVLAFDRSWPSRRSGDDPITVTYKAGYESAPAPVTTAALMHIRAMFDEKDEGAGFPEAAKRLLAGNYRRPRVSPL